MSADQARGLVDEARDLYRALARLALVVRYEERATMTALTDRAFTRYMRRLGLLIAVGRKAPV